MVFAHESNSKLISRRRHVVKIKQYLGRKASRKSLRKYCLEIWSELVRIRDGYKCFMCGAEKYLNAHHLISKKWIKTAFEVDCGITICAGCHDFRMTSAHTSPWVLEGKLERDRPDQHKWFITNRVEVRDGPQDEIDYQLQLAKLFEEYEKVRPVEVVRPDYFKFNQDDEVKIMNDFKSGMQVGPISEKWKCDRATIQRILDANGINRHSAEYIRRTKEIATLISSKPIIKMDGGGQILCEYKSVEDAMREHKVTSRTIYNCAIGRTKSAVGFRWIYKENYNNPDLLKQALEPKITPRPVHGILRRPIAAIGVDRKEYQSISDAIKDGNNQSCLMAALRSGKPYKGYKWEYTTEGPVISQ